jgi:hypothetical protein
MSETTNERDEIHEGCRARIHMLEQQLIRLTDDISISTPAPRLLAAQPSTSTIQRIAERIAEAVACPRCQDSWEHKTDVRRHERIAEIITEGLSGEKE